MLDPINWLWLPGAVFLKKVDPLYTIGLPRRGSHQLELHMLMQMALVSR
jgi:hypothetical protein